MINFRTSHAADLHPHPRGIQPLSQERFTQVVNRTQTVAKETRVGQQTNEMKRTE